MQLQNHFHRQEQPGIEIPDIPPHYYTGVLQNTSVRITEEVIGKDGDSDIKRFIIRMLVSNKDRDSYWTVMQDDTLDNFVADAIAGVNFQDSHIYTNTGYGYSVGAERIKDDVFVDMAVLEDESWQKMTYPTGKDLIFALRYRPFDVSVGFYGGDVKCSICGNDPYTWSCEHYLGEQYVVDDEIKDCEGLIFGAHLAEVSLVFDGANYSAGTIRSRYVIHRLTEKTEYLLRHGKLEVADALKIQARMGLPKLAGENSQARIFPAYSYRERNDEMPAEKSKEALQRENDDLTESKTELESELEELRTTAKTDRETIRDLKADVKSLKARLQPFDVLMEQMRDECVEKKGQILKDTEHALTEDSEAVYRKKLAKFEYEELQEELEDHKRTLVIAINNEEVVSEGGESEAEGVEAPEVPEEELPPDPKLLSQTAETFRHVRV